MTVYPVTGEPPVFAGAVHDTTASVLPATALTPVGTPGTVTGMVTLPPSIVTAPLRANSLPSTSTAVVEVTEMSATMVPINVDYVPRVAELPICQKTFAAWAPLTSSILLELAVVSVLPA